MIVLSLIIFWLCLFCLQTLIRTVVYLARLAMSRTVGTGGSYIIYGTGPAEVRAIRNHRTALVDRIAAQVGPLTFSLKLEENDFVGDASRIEGSKGEKVSSLLRAVEIKIEHDPNPELPFKTFVEILESLPSVADLGQALDSTRQMIKDSATFANQTSKTTNVCSSSASPKNEHASATSGYDSEPSSHAEVSENVQADHRHEYYPSKSLSFHNVDERSHVYTVPDNTDGPLREEANIAAQLATCHPEDNSSPSFVTGMNEQKQMQPNLAASPHDTSSKRHSDTHDEKFEETHRWLHGLKEQLSKEKEDKEKALQDKEKALQDKEKVLQEVKVLRVQVEKISTEKECLEKNIEEHKEELAKKEREYKAQIEKSKQQLAEKERELQQIRSEHETTKKENETLKSQLETKEKELAQTQMELLQRQVELANAETKLAQAETKVERVEKELAQAETKVERVEKELAQTKAESAIAEVKLKAKIEVENKEKECEARCEKLRKDSAAKLECKESEILRLKKKSTTHDVHFLNYY